MADKKKPVIHTPNEESWRRLEAAEKNYVHPRKWSPEQEKKLERFYGKVPRGLLIKELQHSWQAITDKAAKMGLQMRSSSE